jgi:predicted N-acyltransferase
MQRAVADYLASERPAVAEAIEEYAERLPFRRGEAESE